MKPILGGKITFRELAFKTYEHVCEHEVFTRANSIAFSAMMAAVPFLALVITISVFLLPDLTGSGDLGIGSMTPDQLHALLRGFFPEEVYRVIADQIARMQSQPPVGILSISVAITLWAASGLYANIIGALNHIYGVKETRPYWKMRLLAILMTIIQSVVALVTVIGIVAWPNTMHWLGLSEGHEHLVSALKTFAVFLVLLGSFHLTFSMGPERGTTGRKWVTPGSVFGAIVFMLATYCFRVYVANFAHYDRVYGSLGGVMMMLFWFYISSVVLLIAAEMNRVVEYASIRNEQIQRRKRNSDARQDKHKCGGGGGAELPPGSDGTLTEKAPGEQADGGKNPSDTRPSV